LSHYSWTEWQALTKEIIAVSIQQGAVIALLGRVAQEYQDAAQGVSADSQVMFLAHPAASRYGKTWRKNLFSGSRFFTTVNSKLEQMAKEPIDWRLP
jgi:uracil DNA glycosylase